MSAREMVCRVVSPMGSLLVTDVVVGEQDAVICPTDYGFLPGTLGHAGQPLEALVCVSEPGERGAWITARAVAVIHVRERVGEIPMIVGVAADDRAWDDVDGVGALTPETRREIERFARGCRPLDAATATVVWGSQADAVATIGAATARCSASRDPRA